MAPGENKPSNMRKGWTYALNEKLDSWPWVSQTERFPLHRALFKTYPSASFLTLLNMSEQIMTQHVGNWCEIVPDSPQFCMFVKIQENDGGIVLLFDPE